MKLAPFYLKSDFGEIQMNKLLQADSTLARSC